MRVSAATYRIGLLLMALAVVPMLVSPYVSWVTGEGHGFQRSGSLMVLFSVAGEHRRRRGRWARCAPPAGERPFWCSISCVCYPSIVMATLIWGYGDLLFRAA